MAIQYFLFKTHSIKIKLESHSNDRIEQSFSKTENYDDFKLKSDFKKIAIPARINKV